MNEIKVSERLRGADCAVLGYGVSNKPLVEWLMAHGARSVTVRDKRSEENMRSAGDLERIVAAGASYIAGEEYLDGITEDIIFRSPGIRPDAGDIPNAVKRGALLSSEMELFFELCPCEIFAVTGSDGKTTTTTVTSIILEEACRRRGGKVYRGGNIGNPLLPEIDKMTPNDICVVELSSFQLMTMKKSPNRAIITNITPNHLNWHTDMDEYVAAKCNVCMHAPISRLVVNAENGVTFEIARNSDVPVTYFSSKRQSYDAIVPEYKRGGGTLAVYEREGVIYISDGECERTVMATDCIKLPGRHNVENYMAALAICDGYAEFSEVEQVARTFGGVPHRLELVDVINGVKYYNSSIDSSPTRTIAALSAMDHPIIICGGQDKHVPFDTLAVELCKSTKAAVLTGEARGQILDALNNHPLYSAEKLPTYIEPRFRDAVLKASALAADGDTVLLSPACTSFDEFNNFAERGECFKSIVKEIKEKG